MKNLFFYVAALLVVAIHGCSKTERIDYIDADAPAPAQVSNIKVQEHAGGATITYQLPEGPNLSYVKAVYEIRPGIFREAKSSIYTDTLSLVGFGDTLGHEVKLYSVGKNEKASAPVTTTVHPKTPAIRSVFETIQLIATFGGVNVAFRNATGAELAIAVMVDTTGQGAWAPVTTFYTGALEGNFSARGYNPVEKKFAVYLQDRWDNKSDTLVKPLTPIHEQLIPKPWTALHLNTDTWQPVNTGYSLEKLWDNKIAILQDGFASSNSALLPQWFTIDFGKKVLINRFKEHQAPTSHLYTGSAVKTFELWGSNDPDTDGGWTKWQLLGTFRSFKPSGLPLGQVSAEDKNYASVAGEDFEFTTIPPAIRYLRFKTLETYSSSGQVVLTELTFWGQVQP